MVRELAQKGARKSAPEVRGCAANRAKPLFFREMRSSPKPADLERLLQIPVRGSPAELPD